MAVAEVQREGFPYRFTLGTTGIVVTCVIELVSGQRTIKEIKYTKLPIFVGSAPVEGTEKQAEAAWELEPSFKLTHRTMRSEIERVTQAVFPK